MHFGYFKLHNFGLYRITPFMLNWMLVILAFPTLQNLFASCQHQHQKMISARVFTLSMASSQSVQVAQSCLTLWDPVDCCTPGFPVHHQLQELTQTHVHRVSDAIQHLILCRSRLLPSIFPSIGVFSSESVLCIRWPKYWSFSFSISPSNEYSGLIYYRID